MVDVKGRIANINHIIMCWQAFLSLQKLFQNQMLLKAMAVPEFNSFERGA